MRSISSVCFVLCPHRPWAPSWRATMIEGRASDSPAPMDVASGVATPGSASGVAATQVPAAPAQDALDKEKDFSIKEILRLYPTRIVHDSQLRSHGQVEAAKLPMWYAAEGKSPEEWTGAELRLPADAASFYLTAADIQGLRCLGSLSFINPQCAGDAGIPCYCAQLRRLHGTQGTQWLRDGVGMWQGILGDFIDPTTGAALPTHPRFIGDLDLLELSLIHI